MKAFLTGGTGFIGGHLAEALRAAGWEVAALARDPARARVLVDAGCRVVRGDVTTTEAVIEAGRDADVAFHLAGITKSVRGREEFNRVNGDGAGRVALQLRDNGFTGRFVLVSSLAAAGPAVGGRPRTEADPEEPVSFYGESKLLGETLTRDVLPPASLVVLRPGAVYGPREHEILEVLRMIARTGVAIQAGPDFRIQMTHVEDVVSACMTAATHPDAAGRTYFVTDPQAWSMREVFRHCGEALGRDARILRVPRAVAWVLAWGLDTAGRIAGRPLAPLGMDKVREMAAGSWLASSEALTRDCGWRAVRTLPQGLRDTVAWYRANNWLP